MDALTTMSAAGETGGGPAATASMSTSLERLAAAVGALEAATADAAQSQSAREDGDGAQHNADKMKAELEAMRCRHQDLRRANQEASQQVDAVIRRLRAVLEA